MDRQIMNAVLSTIGDSDVAVPEGYLYAGLLGKMGLSEFQAMIGFFIKAELVTRKPGPTIRPTRKLLDVVQGFKVAAGGK